MDNVVKPTAKCKCGQKADFIKDYFVTESKKVKEKTYDEAFVSSEEYVCGIIRRRFCGRCLSKIAAHVRRRDKVSNAVIILSVFIPLLLATVKFAVDTFLLSVRGAMLPFVIMAAVTVIATLAVSMRFGREQGKRKRIEKGIYTDHKSIDLLLDSLNYGITDYKKLKEIPSIDIVADGEGRVNYGMERSGFSMRIMIEGKINIEPMTERMKYPFEGSADYVRKTYVNAGLLNDNMRLGKGSEQSKKDIAVKNGTVVRYSGLATKVEIPSEATAIGTKAFMNSKNCEIIILPDTVTAIGKEAFSGCPAAEINIPSGVKVISSFAFYGSGLKEVVLPDGVETVDDRAFAYCPSLERVVIPASCKRIGASAFRGCGLLKELTLSEGVEAIGDYAFSECTSLKDIYIPDGVFEIGNFSFENCTALENVRLPDSVQFMGGRAFDGARNVVFRGEEGSYAQSYADSERKRFALINQKYSKTKKNR